MTQPKQSSLHEQHPVVQWVRRELLPLLHEALAPTAVIVFDPPDRPSAMGDAAPGVLIVSSAFESVPMPERLASVRHLTRAVSPMRPMCLTPGEYEIAAKVPGPVIGAARTGLRIL